MPPIDLLLPFIAATALFAFIPGPGMVYMSIQTMARGPKAGWLSAAGFHLAAYLHIVAAAFGVTALLHALPALFVGLKLAGAAYLVWMGLKLVLDGRRHVSVAGAVAVRSARQAFKDSVTVELLNPKTALFFLAFLPPFASAQASAPIWLQIVVLGGLANIVFTSTDVLCIVFSDRLRGWAAASATMARIGRRIGGGIFVAMGLHIAARGD